MTDNQLIDLVHDGDQEALGILYEKYFDRVLQYAYRRTFDKQIAYDITANVFMKIAEKISNFKPKHENAFVGWIFKIASNETVSYYRKPEKYKSSIELTEALLDEDYESAQSTEAEFLDTMSLYKELHRSMRQLNQKEQQIIDLYYFENMSYKDIAESTGIKESNVGVILHRSVKKLQTQLQPLLEGAAL